MHKWDRRLRPPPLGVRPFRWRDAEDEPTRNQLRNKQWLRTSQGSYVPAKLERPPEQRIIEAAVLLPDSGAVSGWAAAYQQGVRFLDGSRRPVLLQLGADGKIRKRSGIELARERLPESDVITLDGVRFAAPLADPEAPARPRLGCG